MKYVNPFYKQEMTTLHPTLLNTLVIIKRNFFQKILFNPQYATENEVKKYRLLNLHLEETPINNEPPYGCIKKDSFTKEENIANIDKLIQKVKKNDLSKI